MATVRLPAALRSYAGGHAEVNVQGDTVSKVIDNLVCQYPSLQAYLKDSGGKLRPYVNVFLGSENVMDLLGMDTIIGEQDRLLLIPSIAGG